MPEIDAELEDDAAELVGAAELVEEDVALAATVVIGASPALDPPPHPAMKQCAASAAVQRSVVLIGG